MDNFTFAFPFAFFGGNIPANKDTKSSEERQGRFSRPFFAEL
jgi:hypothetical protein